MLEKDRIKISGEFTIGDWKNLRKRLLYDNKVDDWNMAIKVFDDRINSRFLEPIDAILNINKNAGEGFAATALMCSLIEYLESFFEGKIYKYIDDKRGELIYRHPFKYSSSKLMFKNFLNTHKPFVKDFNDKLADIFYEEIRCGLLHEAATKGMSLIRSENSNLLIDKNGKGIILYRSNFQKAIKEYIQNYKNQLYADETLKKSFVRKMDDIALIDKVDIFVYGSLLKNDELKTESELFEQIGVAYLNNYEFLFNKVSKDNSSKANVRLCEGSVVWGYCYQIDNDDFKKLQEREKGYTSPTLKINLDDKSVINARVFISSQIYKTNVKPNDEYFNNVIDGAKEKGLPDDYITEISKLLLI